MKKIFLIVLLISFSAKLIAQGVAINTTGVNPDNSAMLDVSSTSSGLLIPRITMAQRNAISSPATSLLIYQTDNTPGYYYNAGTPAAPNWIRLATTGLDGSGAATRVAFWSGTNTLSSDANLYWDNTNSRLGIGTTSPSYNLHVQNTGGASSAKIGYTSSYTDNRLFFGDGSYVYVGEYNADDRLYLHGRTISIDINGSLGSNGQVLTSNGTTVSWGDISGGGVSMGCANNNYITKRQNATTLSCSQLYDNGTTVQIGSTTLTNSKLGISYSSTDIYGIYVTMPGWAIFGDASLGGGGRGIMGSGGECGVYGYHGSQTSVLGRLGYYDNTYYYGVFGQNKRTNTGTIHYGIYGNAEGKVTGGSGTDKNIAVRGRAGNHNLMNVGVFGDVGTSAGTNNYGVYGDATSTATAYGVYGKAHDCTTGYGVYGEGMYGVYGYYNSSHYGYLGSNQYGVYGRATSANGDAGVYGYNGSGAWGALGYYTGSTVYAGYFSGNVNITGSISKGSGSFLIDHPLDPLNKTLRHNFVESPGNLCIYPGKIKLDASGKAEVKMPDYYIALVKEEEAIAQITPVGKPFLTGCEWSKDFTTLIIYGEPDREIYYSVIADRDDPVIHQLYKPVEEEKGNGNFTKGKLLYPKAYGYPKEMGEDYESNHQREMEK